MIQHNIEIINKLGLHARAAAKLVSTATNFSSAIKIRHASQTADGKSIMAVMMLAAAKGSTIEIEVDGDDEENAWLAISALINNYFDEGE